MRYLFAVFFIVCAGACGGSDTTDACADLGLQSRIVYGTVCSSTSSAIARLELLDGEGDRIAYCSGALISPDRVLSAAHCVLGEVRAIRVEVGGELIPVNSFAAHPNNEVTNDGIESSEADIAILALSRRSDVPPLPLNQTRTLIDGERFSVFGYGLDQDGDSGALRSGEMFIEDVDSNVIRAEHVEESSGICFGDSGGPAIILDADGNPSVIGVSSALERPGLFDDGLPGFPFPLPFNGDEDDCELGAKNYFASIQSQAVINFLRETAPEVVIQ